MAPNGTCVDPAFEHFDLFRAERFGQFGWRHDLIGIMTGDAGDQLAFAGFAGNDGF